MAEAQDLPASRIFNHILLFSIKIHGKQVISIRVLSKYGSGAVDCRPNQPVRVIRYFRYSTTLPSEKLQCGFMSNISVFLVWWYPKDVSFGTLAGRLRCPVGRQRFK